MAFDPTVGRPLGAGERRRLVHEINRVEPGFNSGWMQIMGPPDRIAQFKAIETTVTPIPPDPLADDVLRPAAAALVAGRTSPTRRRRRCARLFMLPGAHYSAPELSWKYEVAPGGIGFVDGRGLGPAVRRRSVRRRGARPSSRADTCSDCNLTGNRREHRDRRSAACAIASPTTCTNGRSRKAKACCFGRNFGVGTDVQTGPNGNLFIVSLTDGAVYEIFARKR